MPKDRFFKVYSNLPEDVRREVIIVISDKPYSWDSVFIEISNDTDLGHKMLKRLTEMELV
jgi:hypothetical protein